MKKQYPRSFFSEQAGKARDGMPNFTGFLYERPWKSWQNPSLNPCCRATFKCCQDELGPYVNIWYSHQWQQLLAFLVVFWGNFYLEVKLTTCHLENSMTYKVTISDTIWLQSLHSPNDEKTFPCSLHHLQRRPKHWINAFEWSLANR